MNDLENDGKKWTCPMDSVEEIMNLAKGKYIDDIEIPKSDVEID